MANIVKFTVVAYCEVCENNKHISIDWDNLHDAEVSRNAFISINESTNNLLLKSQADKFIWHGYVRRWEGYPLDDGSWVTVSCDAIPELDF